MDVPGYVAPIAFGVSASLVVIWAAVRISRFRERWTADWARRYCARLRREEEAGVSPKAADYRHAISFDEEGFTVRDLREQKPPVTMRWRHVERVRLFKRDLLTHDCICMFLADAQDIGLELNEEMAGWNAFVKELPVHLPGCRSDWEKSVALPPFATNETELYRRAAASGLG